MRNNLSKATRCYRSHTETQIHTVSFNCRRLGLTSSIRSHNNYLKLLHGAQVLVGYITSTLTSDGFHPVHTYIITFCLFVYSDTVDVCVCEVTNAACVCKHTKRVCEFNVYILRALWHSCFTCGDKVIWLHLFCLYMFNCGDAVLSGRAVIAHLYKWLLWSGILIPCRS